ncbi:whirlin [Platysternon megacephalum]|uniref:Whirlin n=1 Tax=Platysternon megacephalum TaxID=55544 RepID=A0A4D9ECC5_9SAUR|nr:whirlin [Platysternon megacephalum]
MEAWNKGADKGVKKASGLLHHTCRVGSLGSQRDDSEAKKPQLQGQSLTEQREYKKPYRWAFGGYLPDRCFYMQHKDETLLQPDPSRDFKWELGKAAQGVFSGLHSSPRTQRHAGLSPPSRMETNFSADLDLVESSNNHNQTV